MKLGTPLPFGLSLSKPWRDASMPLRHADFGKLSPLLRANGCFMRRGPRDVRWSY